MQKLPVNDLSQIKHVIAVMSGKGGVGKSSVSALLATALNRLGFSVGLMDTDITGPSIPKMFGLKDKPRQTDLGMFPLKSRTGIEIVSLNPLLEHEDDPVIWRGPLLGQMVGQFWTDVIWNELDYLVLDLPPGTGDIPLTVMQSIPVEGIVLVSSPQDLVYMEVKKTLKMANMLQIPILGLVENMSFLLCPHCGEEIELFGQSRAQETADVLGIPLLARVPLDPDFARLCDAGAVEDYDRFPAAWVKELATAHLTPAPAIGQD